MDGESISAIASPEGGRMQYRGSGYVGKRSIIIAFLIAPALVASAACDDASGAPTHTNKYMSSGECRVYVAIQAAPGGDGASWKTAASTITDSLRIVADIEPELSSDTDEDPQVACAVWVAEGSYSLFDEASSENMPLIVRGDLFGGFAGDETLLSQRNWVAHPTTLDARSHADPDKGLWVGMYLYDTAVVDGFFITGVGDNLETWLPPTCAISVNGDAEIRNSVIHDNSSESNGAAVFQETGRLEIDRVYFVDNTSSGDGGALFSNNGQIHVASSVFTGNQTSGDGGALAARAAYDEQVIRVENSTFSYNWAGGTGGAVSISDAWAVFEGTEFHDNGAEIAGGGAHVDGSGPSGSPQTQIVFDSCSFFRCRSGQGGGLFLAGSEDPLEMAIVLDSCSFSRCQADQGGGLYLAGTEDDPLPAALGSDVFTDNEGAMGAGLFASDIAGVIEGCKFDENTASENGGGAAFVRSNSTMNGTAFSANAAAIGGGVFAIFSELHLAASVFRDNAASERGGAVHQSLGEVELWRATIAGNAAPTGGAVSVDGGAVQVLGSVIWVNENPLAGSVEAACSDIQGGIEGAIDADPLFVDPGNGDYRLSAGSPCIDAVPDGCALYEYNVDIDGTEPIDVPGVGDDGVLIDMGAFEFVP
jgi:hypothetical protein